MKKTITAITDYQNIAKDKLPKDFYGYFSTGSDDEVTLKNNISAFDSIYLAPRVLIDMSKFSMNTKILGQQVSIPFGIAPVAMQKMLHPKGQLLTAAEAYRQKTAFGLSMLTSTKVSEVAAVNPSGLKILQLYFVKKADYTLNVIRIAEQKGFKALAITVDTQMFGKRRVNERTQFNAPVQLELFRQLGYNFKMRDDNNRQLSAIHQFRHDLSWEDIIWIKKNTFLKIILKGVMCSEDIPMAQKCGVDAIWISNHGGRQLDTAPATILALPPIRRKLNQIGSKIELYIDGGVRKGSDIFKCLALGADFVFLGRGFVFSAIQGEEGVRNAFKILKQQLRTVMMLCGTNSIQKITEDAIWKYPRARL